MPMQRYPSLRLSLWGCFRSVFNTFSKSRRSSRGLKRFTNLSLNSSPCVKSCESSLGGLSLPRWQLVVGSSGVHLTQYWRWRNCEPVAQQAATILRDLLPRRQECMLGIFTMKYAHTHFILSFLFFTHTNAPQKEMIAGKYCVEPANIRKCVAACCPPGMRGVSGLLRSHTVPADKRPHLLFGDVTCRQM